MDDSSLTVVTEPDTTSVAISSPCLPCLHLHAPHPPPPPLHPRRLLLLPPSLPLPSSTLTPPPIPLPRSSVVPSSMPSSLSSLFATITFLLLIIIFLSSSPSLSSVLAATVTVATLVYSKCPSYSTYKKLSGTFLNAIIFVLLIDTVTFLLLFIIIFSSSFPILLKKAYILALGLPSTLPGSPSSLSGPSGSSSSPSLLMTSSLSSAPVVPSECSSRWRPCVMRISPVVYSSPPPPSLSSPYLTSFATISTTFPPSSPSSFPSPRPPKSTPPLFLPVYLRHLRLSPLHYR